MVAGTNTRICRPLDQRLECLSELNDIYSAYVKGYESELHESRMVVHTIGFEEERATELYIPQFYNMCIMPFNKFNEPLIKNALDSRIATIWCDNTKRDRKPLNPKTRDYLLAHYLNLVVQVDEFNPVLLYPNFKTGELRVFNSSNTTIPDSIAKEFVENDYWGKLVISVGDKLGEL